MTILREKPLSIRRMVYAALCLAMAMVLPFLTGQIPEIGSMLCPMHLPVLLCGFLCGWPWGLTVGIAAPLLRSLIFGMPPLFPAAVAMAPELAVYGLFTGLMYHLFPKKIPYLYVSLLIAMVAGRLIWGAVQFVLAGFDATAFSPEAFLAGAILTAWPGILLQLALVPLLVLALRRARLL